MPVPVQRLAQSRTAYFNEVLIEENLVLSFTPMPFTTAMMASEIPAAINPYSIAVAADSSARNRRMVCIGPIWASNLKTH